MQGVFRAAASQPRNTMIPPPLDRIRAQFDAAFFAINSTVAQTYAADEGRRELLREAVDLTFTAGDSAIPERTLKAYIEDATFYVAGKRYSFRRYPDFQRGGDPRLGLWTQVGETIKAKTPQPVVPFSGTGAFTSICSPPIPATESAEFVAPDDYYPDLIAAMIQYILGQTMETAAQTA